MAKIVKKPKLFTAELMHKNTRVKSKGWTHAYSFKQALRNLGLTHPNDRVEVMTDTVTGLKFTRQEWLQLARRGERD